MAINIHVAKKYNFISQNKCFIVNKYIIGNKYINIKYIFLIWNKYIIRYNIATYITPYIPVSTFYLIKILYKHSLRYKLLLSHEFLSC